MLKYIWIIELVQYKISFCVIFCSNTEVLCLWRTAHMITISSYSYHCPWVVAVNCTTCSIPRTCHSKRRWSFTNMLSQAFWSTAVRRDHSHQNYKLVLTDQTHVSYPNWRVTQNILNQAQNPNFWYNNSDQAKEVVVVSPYTTLARGPDHQVSSVCSVRQGRQE